MHSLTTEQEQTLLDILNEEFGSDMEFEDFTDALLGLLEDVSGFETAPPVVIDELTHRLWSQYYG